MQSGVSCAMVLTAYFAISPETGLFCLRHPQEALLPKNLIPASGHQDHATSPSACECVRRTHSRRPPHPALNVRDDAYAPLIEAGRVEIAGDLASSGSEIFFRPGLDDPNHVEMARRNRFYAHGILAALTGFKANARAKNDQMRHRRGGVTRHRNPLISAQKQRDHLLPLFDRQRASLNACAPSLMDGIVR
jgi:hypothetical protein